MIQKLTMLKKKINLNILKSICFEPEICITAAKKPRKQAQFSDVTTRIRHFKLLLNTTNKRKLIESFSVRVKISNSYRMCGYGCILDIVP